MNNWQDWVVGVLVVLCIARVIYGIFLFFRRMRENQNPCDSCVSGCELYICYGRSVSVQMC